VGSVIDIVRRLRPSAVGRALRAYWQPLPPPERDSMAQGAFQLMGQTLLGTFLPLLLLDGLHATPQDMALLNSLPNVVGLAAVLLGLLWLRRTTNLLGLTLAAVVAARAVYPLMAAAPFLGPTTAVALLLGLNAAMNFPGAIANMSWQAYIGELIAPERRAGFFAERNRLVNFAAMMVAIAAGGALQLLRPTLVWPYQAALAAAAVTAVFEIRFLRRHPAVMPPRPEGAAGWTAWRRLLTHGRFPRVFWSAMIYNLVWQMAWPLFPLFQIGQAHATAFWVALFGVLGQLGAIMSLRAWGTASERWGIAWPLFVAALGVGTSPALLVLSRSMDWLALINLQMGVVGAGFQMLLFNQLLEAAPRAERTTMVAVYNVGLAVVGMVAPEIGVFLLAHLHMRPTMDLDSLLRLAASVGFLWAGGVRLVRRWSRPVSPSA
jgi:hypothetical protein